MDAQSKKLALIQWIIQLNDEQLLDQVEAIREKDNDFWRHLTDEQRARIKRGVDQLAKGEKFDYEQILAKYR